MTVSDDISSSKDESLHTCNKFLQPEEVEKEIKKKKKSKRSKKKHSAQATSQLENEIRHSDSNTTLNEGVTKSEKVNLCSADTVRTQKFTATNQVHTPEDESVVFRKEKKNRKPSSETEDHTLCEGTENMKQEHRNMDSLGTGSKKRRKKKWKDIPSKVTSTKGTQMMDIAHEEYFGSYPKKRKR
jgi:hypothetical protein